MLVPARGKCLPGGGEHQSFCRCDGGIGTHQGVESSDNNVVVMRFRVE